MCFLSLVCQYKGCGTIVRNLAVSLQWSVDEANRRYLPVSSQLRCSQELPVIEGATATLPLSTEIVLALPAALLAALLAGSISGLSGFGYALVSVPLLLIVFEPTTVIVALSFIGIFINALIVHDSSRFVAGRALVSLLPWSALGLIVGVEILRLVDAVYIELVAGSLVIAFSIMLLREWALPGLKGRWGPVLAGTSAGIMSTSTGIGGPPVVMLFAARKLARDVFRATNAAYFMTLACLTLSLLFVRGMVEWQHLWIAALLVPAAFVGKALGTWTAARLSGTNFRKITLGITLIAGCLGVFSAVRELLGGFL